MCLHVCDIRRLLGSQVALLEATSLVVCPRVLQAHRVSGPVGGEARESGRTNTRHGVLDHRVSTPHVLRGVDPRGRKETAGSSAALIAGVPTRECRVERALKGWRRHTQVRRRRSLRHAVTAMRGCMLSRALHWEGFAMCPLFVFYFRPRKFLCLKNVIALMPRSGVPFWAIALKQEEEGTLTKTSQFDETLLFDVPWDHFIIPALQQSKTKRAPTDPLVVVTSMQP